jgi:hypothetical protein
MRDNMAETGGQDNIRRKEDVSILGCNTMRNKDESMFIWTERRTEQFWKGGFYKSEP